MPQLGNGILNAKEEDVIVSPKAPLMKKNNPKLKPLIDGDLPILIIPENTRAKKLALAAR